MTLHIAFRHAYPGRTFDVAFQSPTPGTTVLFGPSGAGKSTIAAVAAGLLRPREVHVEVDGVVLADSATGLFVPPERRRVGIVFQDARLFPHLSVAANLRYASRRATRSAQAPIAWREVIDLLALADLLARRPATLSGGERQRVAIGRALLSQPRLLIMDEPLAGLDQPRRAEIMPFLAHLTRRLALPILYVTHATDELARLADTLVLIEAGRSIAAGPLAELAARADLPGAAGAQTGAVLDAHIAAHLPARALTRLALTEAPGLHLLVPLQSLPPGTRLRVRIPAAEIILAHAVPEAISVQNVLPATIHAIVPADAGQSLVELRLAGARLLARITTDAATRLALAPASEIVALIKSVSIQVLA